MASDHICICLPWSQRTGRNKGMFIDKVLKLQFLNTHHDTSVTVSNPHVSNANPQFPGAQQEGTQ